MSTRDKIDSSDCHFCARTNEIQAHHIVPERFEGRDIRENLVGVCERCHKKLERLYDKRFYERLGIRDETGERHQHFECVTNECRQRAKVKIAQPQCTVWLCIRCATERYTGKRTVQIIDDPTGRMDNRRTWIDFVGQTTATTGGAA